MGAVTDLAAYRAAKAQPQRPALLVARSPELCLILAMLDVMPAKARSKAMLAVMAMADAAPDDEAGRVAAHFAACVTLAKGAR